MTMPTLRWAVAVLVTVAVFAAATWVCGALVLTMRDAGVKWGIAGGLGVAVAALAALWGHSYATADHEQSATDAADILPASARKTSNKISGGTFHGPVIQARDVGPLNFAGPAVSELAQPQSPERENPPAER